MCGVYICVSLVHLPILPIVILDFPLRLSPQSVLAGIILQYLCFLLWLTLCFVGSDDKQFEEEKELIIKEIERISHLPNVTC